MAVAFNNSPFQFLATMAMAASPLLKAASTLMVIPPWSGGVHLKSLSMGPRVVITETGLGENFSTNSSQSDTTRATIFLLPYKASFLHNYTEYRNPTNTSCISTSLVVESCRHHSTIPSGLDQPKGLSLNPHLLAKAKD